MHKRRTRIEKNKIFAVLIVIAGVLLLLYPWFSNWIYDKKVDSSVKVMEKEMAQVDAAEEENILETAKQYNKNLAESKIALTDPFVDTGDEEEDIKYLFTLSLDERGMMGFVEIPKIDVCLPIFHGTSDDVLKMGAGHLEGSSLPVGGASTHAVISAHTGINSSKMFSDLTEMKKGDLFFIRVLGNTLAYRVCRIEVIEPEDTQNLVIEEGKDLVSLITCTPYGTNTQRLVVTGERTEYSQDLENEAKGEKISDTSQWMKAYRNALMIGIGIVIILAVLMIVTRVVRKGRTWSREEKE